MALLLSAGSFASLLADNKLSIDDITVLPNHNYVISVKMENDADITAVDANLVLPQGMTIVRTFDQYAVSSLNHGKQVNFILNDARTYGEDDKDEDGNAMRRHEFLDASQNGEASPYKIGIKHDRNLPFVGESGTEVFHFTVHTTDDLADTTEIKLTNIKFVHQMTGKDKQDDFASKVYKVERMPMQAVVYPADPVLTVNPDNGQVTVEIKMRTNRNVRGIDARIKLPAGLYVSGGYQVINNADPSKQLDIEANKVSQDETGTIYKMIMSHTSSSHKIETINDEFDDKIFAFIVSANDNLLDGSKIQISDITIVSDEKAENGFNDEVVAPDTVIIINNPKVAVKAGEARELVDGLQAQVDGLSVPQEVRDCPDEEVKDLVAKADSAIAAAQDFVDALETIVEDAIADGIVATDAKQQEIADAAQAAQDAIDRAQAAIDEAEDLYDAKYGANEEANTRMNKQLDDLQLRLNWAKDQMLGSPVQPEFVDEAAVIQDSIDSLRNYVKEQYEAKKLTKESSIDGGVQAADQAITDMLTSFRQEEAKYNENRNAYANLKPQVKQLREAMTAAEAAINALPDVAADYNDAIDELNDKLDSLEADLEERYANRELTLDFKIGDPTIDDINALVDAAQAAQAAEDAAGIAADNTLKDLTDRKLKADEDAELDDIVEKVAGEEEAARQALDVLDDFIFVNKGDLTKPEVADELADLEQAAEDAVAAYEQAVFENGALVRLNQERKEALNDALDNLDTDALDDAIEDLQDNCPFIDQDKIDELNNKADEIDQAIEDLREDINAIADERGLTDDEKYDSLQNEVEKLQQQIDEVIAEAQAIADEYAEHHQLGDVNMDGTIDVADFQRIVYLVLHTSEMPAKGTEEFLQADVNKDGKVNIADAQAVLNAMSTTSRDMNAADASNDMVSARLVSANGNTRRYALTLDNNATYGAFQADLVLPEGMRVVGQTLGSRAKSHSLMSAEQGDNVLRIVVASAGAQTIKGQSGDVVYIDVEGSGELSFDNVIFADMQGRAHQFAVNANEATGISNAAVAGKNSDNTVYSLGGRLMNTLKKGVNIIRRADGTTQKVIK